MKYTGWQSLSGSCVAGPDGPVVTLYQRAAYPTMSSISFQSILDTALADYSKQVGIDLATHPLSNSVQSCGSPNDILKLLEDKAKEFRDFRGGNRRLINWLGPVVHIVYTSSAVLGASLTLVSRNTSFFPSPFLTSFETRFRSNQQMPSLLGWVFSLQYVYYHHFPPHAS